MQPQLFSPKGLMEGLAYYAEPAMTVGSSLAAEIPAGLAGIAYGDPDMVERVHHDWTYIPRTESGREGVAKLGEGLSGLGRLAMDTPYLGSAIRNFGDTKEQLIEAGYPGLAAALHTAPAAVAMMVPGGEGARAVGAAERGVAGLGRDALMEIARGPRTVAPWQSQAGYIRPSIFSDGTGRNVLKLTNKGKSAASALAGERAAERVGSGLERTHKAYVAEKTAEQQEVEHGRNLLRH